MKHILCRMGSFCWKINNKGSAGRRIVSVNDDDHDPDLAGLDHGGGGGHPDGDHGGAEDHQEGGHLRHSHPRPTLQTDGVQTSVTCNKTGYIQSTHVLYCTVTWPQPPDGEGDEV